MERDVYDDIHEMRFHFLVSKCMKETEWHNTGMLMNMQANALKIQDHTNKRLSLHHSSEDDREPNFCARS